MPHFIYKYKQLKNRIPYDVASAKAKEEREKEESSNSKQSFHLGQLKLFMCELFFLSRYINLDKVILLYVGAANGYHTHLMARLFPQFMFHLYDKTPFHKIYTNEPLPNVKLFHKYFSHQDAYVYKRKNMNLLFMCDMRDIDIKNAAKNKEENEIDDIVAKDMEDQMEWAEIMQPCASYLKFRLPWYIKRYKYFKGRIYLQPYGPLSTETRLYITNHNSDNKKNYNCTKFDERLAYFIFFLRQEKISTKWDKILEKYNIRQKWDNIYSLFICESFLKKSNKRHTQDDTIKFFIKIIDFHQEENKKKYSIIYDKSS